MIRRYPAPTPTSLPNRGGAAYRAAVDNGRWLVSALIAACALAAVSCSSNDRPRLASNCDAVFGSAATDAEGTCDGPDGKIHVYGTDCDGGPQLMLAEDSGGGDYAWARVGDSWHRLSEEGTNSGPFRDCSGG